MSTDDNSRIFKARGLEKEFTILRNKEAQRSDLTYEALGLYVYLMSLPENWEIRLANLQRDGSGRDRIQRMMKELAEKGYVALVHDRNTLGQTTGSHYEAFAYPELNPHRQPEKPLTGLPLTGNPQQQSKEGRKEIKKQTPAIAEPVDYAALILSTLTEANDWMGCTTLCCHIPDCPSDLFDTFSFSEHPAQVAMDKLYADGKVEWAVLPSEGRRSWRLVPDGEKKRLYGVHSHDNFQTVKRAVQQYWGVGGNGLSEQIAKLVCGINKNKGWKQYAEEFAKVPMSVTEIQAFCQWYKTTNPTLSLPESPAAIENWVAKFRATDKLPTAASHNYDNYGD